MTGPRQIVNPTKMGGDHLRLIGTTDIDGKGTEHEIAEVDPIVLFDFAKYNTREPSSFRPHPHFGLTAMSFLPKRGTIMAWDSLAGDSKMNLRPGGLYYVHAGSPAFHHEFSSPESVAAEIDVEFLQLVWNATDEDDVKTVIIPPEEVPVIQSDNATIRVLAGEFGDKKSVQPFTHREIIYLYVELQNGKSMDMEIPASFKGMLFVIEGRLNVNDTSIDQEQMMILGDEEVPLLIGNTDDNNVARFVVAAGEPVNKPFYKLIGLGGFIIGETEEGVRAIMSNCAETAEQLKTEIPQYFPTQ